MVDVSGKGKVINKKKSDEQFKRSQEPLSEKAQRMSKDLLWVHPRDCKLGLKMPAASRGGGVNGANGVGRGTKSTTASGNFSNMAQGPGVDDPMMFDEQGRMFAAGAYVGAGGGHRNYVRTGASSSDNFRP